MLEKAAELVVNFDISDAQYSQYHFEDQLKKLDLQEED